MGRLLTEREVSARLGTGRGRTYELMRTGVLPVVRLGLRSVRVDEDVLEEWIRHGGSGSPTMAPTATRTE